MVSATKRPSQGLTFRDGFRELPVNLRQPGISGENEWWRDGLNLQEISTFILISLNGAPPRHNASPKPAVWREVLAQFHFSLNHLRKPQGEMTEP